MSADVVVVGSFMMDHTAYVTRRPHPGETVRGQSFAMTEGGKGFNQAVAAARAGAGVRMVGRLGQDELGARFLTRMHAEGIDSAGTRLDETVGTGVGLPVVDDRGENAIVVVPAANDRVTADDVAAHADLLTDARVLLIQREIPDEAGTHAAALVRAAGGLVILNPAPAGPVDAFRGLVDVVVPNEGELLHLAQGDDDEARARDLAAQLGGCKVIVTLGAEGVLLVDDDSCVRVPAEAAVPVDTTGAGDCFCGNLAARIALGDSMIDAIGYAVVAAGIAVERPGASDSAPTSDEVQLRISARRDAAGAVVGTTGAFSESKVN